MKTLVSVDFSLNSIGFTIKQTKCRFGAYVNARKISGVGIEKHVFKTLDVKDTFNRPENSLNKKVIDKKMELNRWHRDNLHQSNLIAKNLYELMSPFMRRDVFFIIENYITNRSGGGNQTIQIIEFTKSFKDIIYNNVPLDRIFLTSAPEIKMIAGKGDFKKPDMLKAFVSDKSVAYSDFHKFCVKHQNDLIKNTKEVRTPAGDVIDSYFGLKVLEKLIS